MIRELLSNEDARIEALDAFRKEVSSSDGAWKSYWLAAAAAVSGELEECREQLTPLLVSENNDLVREATSLLAEVEELLGKQRAVQTDADSLTLYETGLRSLDKGEYGEAERLLLLALDRLEAFEISAAEQILLRCAPFLKSRGRQEDLRSVLLRLGDRFSIREQILLWIRRFGIDS